jgi:uncharacterized membrane protein YraQ (UPF0718 family)
MVLLFSMVKFAFAPLMGLAFKLPIYQTIVASIIGMMLTVTVVSYAGPFIKKHIINRFWPTKILFSKKNRRIVTIWKKYGLAGVAFLAPIINPIVATLIAASFGEKASKILLFMLISSVSWAVVISYFVYEIKQLLA